MNKAISANDDSDFERDTELFKDLYVFDFDGTLIKGDMLALVLIAELLNPIHIFVFFRELLFFAIHNERGKFRNRLFSTFWGGKEERAGVALGRIVRFPLMKGIVNESLMDFFLRVIERHHVVIITANYRMLVEKFLSIIAPQAEGKYRLIGTEYGSSLEPIVKGSEKLRQLREYRGVVDPKRARRVINFFDSESDMVLCGDCDVNVVVGRRNYKKLSRLRDGLCELSVFLDEVKP